MRRALLSLALLAVLGIGTSSTFAAKPSAASQYGYPWRGQVPVTVTIRDHSAATYRPYIEQSAADWSASGVVMVAVTASDGDCALQGRVTLCSGAYGLGNVHPAFTVYSARNSYMTDAAIYLNTSYLDGYVNPDGVPIPPYTSDQLAHTVCHEMGNALGLLTGVACTDAGGWQTHPTAADLAQMLDIYGG